MNLKTKQSKSLTKTTFFQFFYFIALTELLSPSAIACTSLPFFLSLNKKLTILETNLYAPLVFAANEEILSLVSVENKKEEDFSPYFKIDTKIEIEKKIIEKKYRVNEKWKNFYNKPAVWIEPITKNLTPLEFYEKTPVEFVFLGQRTQNTYQVKLLFSKKSITTEGTCRFSPKVVSEK